MRAKRTWLLLLLPLAFLAFATLAWRGLERDNPEELPSALVGEPAPSLAGVTPLGPHDAPTEASLKAPGVKLLNFWASWCAPCRAEHPQLTALAEQGIPIIGINYKDKPEAALGWLRSVGSNPFNPLGADATGRTGLDWGIYGVPETFVIDGNGNVVMRFAGPLTRSVVEKRLMPAIKAAEAAG